MKKRAIGLSLAARVAAFTLTGALIAGCSASSRLLPAVPGGASELSAPRAGDGAAPDRSGAGSVRVLMQIRIPRRTSRRSGLHPATISPLTHSVSIAIDTAKAQVFNTTATSPDCTTGSTGTTCTFAAHAPAGTDTFTVTTYSGVNATGAALDRGIALKVPISKGKANHVAIKLGPLVTTVADTGTGSLRYAVQTAGSGDTITFSLPKPSTITLASPILISGALTIAGPGAADVVLSGGGTHQLFKIQGNVTISGLTLTKGKAATPGQPGGAIFNIGNLTLASDTIGSNTSTASFRRVSVNMHSLKMFGLHPHCSTTPAEGGAIFNGGTLTMSLTTFTGNKVSNDAALCIVGEGGAIYNTATGNLSSTHDTYTGNAGAEGGAVYSTSLGGATFTADTFSANTGCTAANGCPTTSCGATSCTSHAEGLGAAIYDAGVGVTVTDTTFTGNVAGGKTAGSLGEGGAIYLDSLFPSITHSTFTSNLAGGGTASCSSGVGGAIYAQNSAELDSDAFNTNAATGDQIGAGGAVVSAVTLTGTGDTFTGNKATGTGGPCTTSATGFGGAIYAGGPVTLTSSAFSGNAAVGAQTGAAGAIFATSVTLSNCAFTSNAATGTGTAGATASAGEGGAVVAGTGATISGSTFTSNSATAEGSVGTEGLGGALVVAGSATVASTGNTFTSNTAAVKTGAGIAAGGAVVVATSSASLASTRDTFSKNSVTTAAGTAIGGAVYATGAPTMFFATMTSNSASGKMSEAGALALTGTTGGTLFHLVATGNSATGTTIGAGGAVIDSAGATIYESTISGNSATSAGGGILIETNAEVVFESSVNGNVVPKANFTLGGGGIGNAGGLTLDASTVSGNSITVSGAGPTGGGGVFSTAPFTLTDSTISGNKVLGSATEAGGGGLFSSASITATNSTISNNTSSLVGGGIASTSASSATLENVTLFKNAATKQGGNIYNDSSSFTLTQSVVGGGTGLTGPDIDNPGTITSGDYNIIQTAVAGTAITTMSHDLTADPKLLPLAENGGSTYTNADQSTSPGKAHIPYSGSMCGSVSITADQRGYTRGHGNVCDSGAYELAGIVSAIAHRPGHRKPASSHHTGKTPIPLPHIAPIRITLPE
ncbi:MAG TPA: choice-of-anchor Q domain-containing protein [Candidatus Baltobacteraceae bacterium]|jgi:hypothetical protein